MKIRISENLKHYLKIASVALLTSAIFWLFANSFTAPELLEIGTKIGKTILLIGVLIIIVFSLYISYLYLKDNITFDGSAPNDDVRNHNNIEKIKERFAKNYNYNMNLLSIEEIEDKLKEHERALVSLKISHFKNVDHLIALHNTKIIALQRRKRALCSKKG